MGAAPARLHRRWNRTQRRGSLRTAADTALAISATPPLKVLESFLL